VNLWSGDCVKRGVEQEVSARLSDVQTLSGWTNPSSPASEDLMSRVQHGDMDAYQDLIREYRSKVFRVVSSYHRDPEDAMEVVQDTFMKVYTSRSTWERKTSFSAWIYRIAINASIDRYRRRDKGRTSSIEDMLEGQLHDSANLPPTRTAVDRLEHLDRRRLIEGAVRRLPARQREVLALRFFADMQLEEIAETLGCPLGTVKSNLHKAVHALRGLLLGKRELLGYE
jgi:RNA polymerase sigma-70 factor, ECF subfamily